MEIPNKYKGDGFVGVFYVNSKVNPRYQVNYFKDIDSFTMGKEGADSLGDTLLRTFSNVNEWFFFPVSKYFTEKIDQKTIVDAEADAVELELSDMVLNHEHELNLFTLSKK